MPKVAPVGFCSVVLTKDRLRLVLRDERFEHVGIDARRRARHAMHDEPGQLEDLQQVAIAGVFDDHRIARAQQRAHDQVERLRRALREQDVRTTSTGRPRRSSCSAIRSRNGANPYGCP